MKTERTIYPPRPCRSFNEWINYIHRTAADNAGHNTNLASLRGRELIELENEIKSMLWR